MSFFRNKGDELSLENAEHFIKPIDKLEFFIRNVPLEIPTFQRTQTFYQIGKALTKSYQQHTNKVLLLWKQFIDRLNNSYMGVTNIHVEFLAVLINEQQFKLALKVIQTPGLPQTITTTDYLRYQLYSANIYIELQKFYNAYECLNLATTIDSSKLYLSFFGLKLLTLVSEILGFKFQKKDFIREFDRLKMTCQKDLIDIMRERTEQGRQLEFQFELFQRICDHSELKKEEENHLKKKQLWDLYQKGNNKKAGELKKYIKRQLKNQNYRLKCSQVKGFILHDFNVIQEVNKWEQVYKYDTKNKIMYFSHRQGSQCELDKMISQGAQMQKVIKNRPIQARVSDPERGDSNQGFLSGLSGLGGIAGSMFNNFRR